MSHIHLPDGIIAPAWWIAGYILSFLILFFILRKINSDKTRYNIPLAGMAGALMLIAMSIPLGFLPLHLSLAVLCGILVGPGLGFVAVFVVNFILALFGHGGITVVGLNTLIIGTEVLVGTTLFRRFARRLKPAAGAIPAAAIAVLVSLVLMVALVTVAVGPGETLPHHSCGHEHVQGETDHHHHYHEHGPSGRQYLPVISGNNYGEMAQSVEQLHLLQFTGWTVLLVILLMGIALEAGATSLIIGYIWKVKPGLITAAHGQSLFNQGGEE